MNDIQYKFERSIGFDEIGEYWSGDTPTLVATHYFLNRVNIGYYNHISDLYLVFPEGKEFKDSLRNNLTWKTI